MSTPRPAMLVEMVTAPRSPARATIAASASSFRAFRTWWAMPWSCRLSDSDSCTLAVPTSTGRPVACVARISSMTAASFVGSGLEDRIRMIDANHRTVGRDHFDVEIVHLAEVAGLRGGRAAHAADGGIERHEILHRDRSEHAALHLRRHALLPLERGLQAARPAPVAHDASLEFVNREHLAVLHDVVDIAMQQRVRVQRLLHRGHHRAAVVGIEITPEMAFNRGEAGRRQRDIAAALVGGIVLPRQPAHRSIGARGQVDGAGSAAGNHQRNAGFVDQRRIRFVEHRDRQRTQHLLGRVEDQLVAQVVEADFVGGAVGDVTLVGRAPLGARHVLLHDADRHTKPAVDAAHPGGVAPRQVVVGGQHVHAVTGTREPGNGRHRRHRLALAGLHLDDLAVGERERSLKLDVEEIEAEHARHEHRRDGRQLRQRHRLL